MCLRVVVSGTLCLRVVMCGRLVVSGALWSAYVVGTEMVIPRWSFRELHVLARIVGNGFLVLVYLPPSQPTRKCYCG